MKIAYLTAGAAGMICGSCLHDNAVAKSLLSLGHDCILIPVYTPIRTDDDDVSIDRVFMGGINVYLQQKLPWLAYLPNWVDGVLNQSWIIKPLTKNAGKTSPKLLGALTISMLQGTEGRQRKEFRRLLNWLARDIKPDVMVLTNLLVGGGIPEVKRMGSTKVFVTLQGDDIFLDSLPAKYRTLRDRTHAGLGFPYRRIPNPLRGLRSSNGCSVEYPDNKVPRHPAWNRYRRVQKSAPSGQTE